MTKCPKCGDPGLIRYSSLQKCQCSNCGAKIPWELKEGQKPLVTSSRDRRAER